MYLWFSFFFLSTFINLDILLTYNCTVCLLWMNVYCPVNGRVFLYWITLSEKLSQMTHPSYANFIKMVSNFIEDRTFQPLLVFSNNFQVFVAVLENSSFYRNERVKTDHTILANLITSEKFHKFNASFFIVYWKFSVITLWVCKNCEVWRFENFSSYI